MAKRPNFLVILADDVGFSDVGCYDLCYESPRSPQTLPQNVDRGAVLKGEECDQSVDVAAVVVFALKRAAELRSCKLRRSR
ncbi:hypothetical protein IWX49DRAFT_587720 [Phyllosticta citricarpa]|uniref:Sulfatase N-terminal domain-containing protein n=1 Tax=Phyllosticta citricarpa TaxID=55181 RepID=A0ABR1MKJ3_9PEZI